MAKRKDSSGSNQLGFDSLWSGKLTHITPTISGNKCVVAPKGNVIAFLDSATLAVRRQAVERVAKSGIFAVPSGKR